MRVLVAHNFYRSSAPSGEDFVYAQESALLEQSGVEVVRFERRNDTLEPMGFVAQAGVGIRAAWSSATYRELRELIERTRPELAHFHNTFPLITAAAYQACRDEGVAVVQTLHNYRNTCAAGTLLRAGEPCELCVGRAPIRALVHRCYRHSVFATAAVVRMQLLNRHRHGAAHNVDRFIALTEFAAAKLVASGLARERIAIKGNFVPDVPAVGDGAGGYVLFVGRLAEEKGVRTLLEAWRILGERAPQLVIVGEGPLAAEVEDIVRRNALPVELCGRQPRGVVMERMRAARLLIVPSLCYEGFPLVVAESLACGTPILASRLGSLAELVANGVTGALFSAGSAAEIANVVAEISVQTERLAVMRRAARAFYMRELTPEKNREQLFAVYAAALRHQADVNAKRA